MAKINVAAVVMLVVVPFVKLEGVMALIELGVVLKVVVMAVLDVVVLVVLVMVVVVEG